MNDSVHAAIGSGKPKPSPSDLRSRWRADRADQASTMTLSSPQTWIGFRASECKTPPGSGVPSRQRGDQCGWWQATRSGVENDSAGRERKISCSSNPGRDMGFQIYGCCPMRLMETQFRCRIGQRGVDTRDGGMYRTRYHRKAPRPTRIGRKLSRVRDHGRGDDPITGG